MTVILYNPRACSDAGTKRTREWVIAHGEDPACMKNILEITDKAAFVESLGEEDRIILCGGDGTLTRLADALRFSEVRVPIYLTAVGTGNDFLHDLRHDGIQDDPVLINEYIKDLPVIYVNGEEHVIVNGVGFGIDGFCAEEGDRQRRERRNKKINYTTIALSGVFGKYKTRNAFVTVDGVTKRYKKVWLAPTMNGRFYGGGFMMTPAQERLNAARTVTSAVAHNLGKAKVIRLFLSVFKGTHVKHTDVFETREGHEVTVRFDTPCALQVDGETFLGVTEYTVRSAPAARAYRERMEQEELSRV